MEGGTELGVCFQKHSKVFDNIYINMIKAGLAGGKLDIFLEKLVGILEKKKKLNHRLKVLCFINNLNQYGNFIAIFIDTGSAYF